MKLENILKIFKRSNIVESSDPEEASALKSYMTAIQKNGFTYVTSTLPYGTTGTTQPSSSTSTRDIKPKNYLSQLIKAKKMTDEELVEKVAGYNPLSLDFEPLDDEVLKSELLKRLAGRHIENVK